MTHKNTSNNGAADGADKLITAARVRLKIAIQTMRRDGGDPSYRLLARQTGYSLSTITRVLTGRTTPRWVVVEDVLDACKANEAHRAVVRDAWRDLAGLVAPIADETNEAGLESMIGVWSTAGAVGTDESGTGRPSPEFDDDIDRTCPRCGAWVVDGVQHEKWHGQFVQRHGPRTLRAVRGLDDQDLPRRSG